MFSMLPVLLKCSHKRREQFRELRMVASEGVISLSPLHCLSSQIPTSSCCLLKDRFLLSLNLSPEQALLGAVGEAD